LDADFWTDFNFDCDPLPVRHDRVCSGKINEVICPQRSSGTSMNLLTVQNLTKEFGKLRAVNDVSFEVHAGDIMAIIGPNGAGKSTLFNLITGYLPVTSGKVIFKNQEITNLPPYRIIQRGINKSFQVANIFPDLTTFENVRIGVLAHRKEGLKLFKVVDKMGQINEESANILRTIGIEHETQTVASNLSHGDQKSLEIGISLTTEPELLLLDEPTAGMGSEETTRTVHLIQEIAQKRGITILFTEHDLNVVFSIAQRIIVLHQGSIIADGTGEGIRQNKKVKEAYLGEEI
jgi:branched-chain amino acid transport system ATP-binding protein